MCQPSVLTTRSLKLIIACALLQSLLACGGGNDYVPPASTCHATPATCPK